MVWGGVEFRRSVRFSVSGPPNAVMHDWGFQKGISED